jgi:RNA polymerase sigma-70 factor (ECF subfamily)
MDEAQIIQQAQQGSIAAFNRLVMTYQGMAYNVAYRVIGTQEGAADACQDAFLKAFKSMRQYRGGSFKSWLMRIITNTCYDQLRYKKRRPSDSLEALMENSGAEPVSMTSSTERPEDNVMRRELNDMLQQGINQLPEDQRIVLILNDVQDFSYQEISEITGQPLGTVKSRLSRARGRLRDFLREQELLPGQYRLKDEP